MENYEIRIKGHIDDRHFRDFGMVQVEVLKGGISLVTCNQFDQASLFAILTKIRDLGLTLIELKMNKAG